MSNGSMNAKGIYLAAALLAILCVLPATTLATPQAPDVLFYKGGAYRLFANPLESFYQDREKRPRFFFRPNQMLSGNWRGYIATWTIENDFLYLVNIDGWICNRDSTGCREADLSELFGKKYRNGKVKADWFSGDIRMPEGEMLEYVHLGYESVFERELIVTVDSGKVVKESMVDNTKKSRPPN